MAEDKTIVDGRRVNEPEPVILHTQKTKREYSDIEKEIKRVLTEIYLSSNLGYSEYTCRGLSITKDFLIRVLSEGENSKFLSNPSNIKSPVLRYTIEETRDYLEKIIKEGIEDEVIANKYKEGINKFFSAYIRNNTKEKYTNLFLEKGESKLFRAYIRQANRLKNVGKRNVKLQVAKILYEKFGDEAFSEKTSKTKSFIVLSDKSLNYICTIFNIANEVRKDRGKSIKQVFHDGDFSFITKKTKTKESNYIDVIVYLLNRKKPIYYGRRGEFGRQQRLEKTAKYADILWALTDNQLRIHELPDLGTKPLSDFKRDNTTQKLFEIGHFILENKISENDNMELSGRLKSIQSCVEKIIEGKNINDTIGLRLSTKGISSNNFDSIIDVSTHWIRELKNNLERHPTDYVFKGETISIKGISVDNKGVLEDYQLDIIIQKLKEIVPTKKRIKIPSPYIELEEWEEKMVEHYTDGDDDLWNDEEKKKILQSFYKEISEGKPRGVNGNYKDFKFNIIFEIKDDNGKIIGEDDNGKIIGERTMEVQFDDVDNGKGLSNYNLRNFERWLNTQSRLGFTVSLSDARQKCEECLKDMWDWADKRSNKCKTKEEKKELFEIEFPIDDNEEKDDNKKEEGNEEKDNNKKEEGNEKKKGKIIDISTFKKRSPRNSRLMDETIVETINYFVKKGTFILCRKQNEKNSGSEPPIKELLTVKNLHNTYIMNNLQICSSLELASQQHSYLQQNWNDKVGIWMDDDKKIGWISLGELIDPMNLGKKKSKEFYV